MLELLGRIGLAVCLCGYAAIVLWVWGWDKRKDRRERRRGESSDKASAFQQSNVSGAQSGESAGMCEEMMLAKIEVGHMGEGVSGAGKVAHKRGRAQRRADRGGRARGGAE